MRMNHNFAPARTLSPPVTFICSGCDCVEHRRTRTLPVGWTTENEGEEVHAYCTDCTGGVEPAVIAAQLRSDNRTLAAMVPVAIIGFAVAWTMLPA